MSGPRVPRAEGEKVRPRKIRVGGYKICDVLPVPPGRGAGRGLERRRRRTLRDPRDSERQGEDFVVTHRRSSRRGFDAEQVWTVGNWAGSIKVKRILRVVVSLDRREWKTIGVRWEGDGNVLVVEPEDWVEL